MPLRRPPDGAVARGDFSALGQALAEHQSFEDWPWPLVYREVAKLSPEAGFILTRRASPQIWLGSLQKHTARYPSEQSRQLRQRFFGADDPWRQAETYLDFYQNHLDSVRSFMAERDLPFLELCWEEGSGWHDLCAWLGVPDVARPTPHSNSAVQQERFGRRVKRIMRRAIARVRR